MSASTGAHNSDRSPHEGRFGQSGQDTRIHGRSGLPESGSAGRGTGGVAAKAGPALLALGIGWILFALSIPMMGLTTGTSISIVLGILLLLSAVSELATAVSAGRDWQPTHALLALLFVVGGVVMLAWPAPTLTVVARVAAWYLLVKGLHDIATAFAQRHAGRQGAAFATDAGHLRGTAPWWIPLVVGAFSVGVAFWAAGHHHPTYSLVVVWVALAALVTGLTRIAAAFRWNEDEDEDEGRGLGQRTERDLLTESGFSGRATAETSRSASRGDTRASAGGRGEAPPRA